ncbi:MAG: hypothetical protein AAF961_01715 [Planctomycetota bacterium]
MSRSDKPRLDLLTLLIATAIWAALLTFMRQLGMPLRGVVAFSLLLGVVTVALVVFRELGIPRLLCMVVGAIYNVCLAWWISLEAEQPVVIAWWWTLAAGALYGYVAGVCIRAAFVISERVRS